MKNSTSQALSLRAAHRVPLQPVILAIALLLAAPCLQPAEAAQLVDDLGVERAARLPAERSSPQELGDGHAGVEGLFSDGISLLRVKTHRQGHGLSTLIAHVDFL